MQLATVRRQTWRQRPTVSKSVAGVQSETFQHKKRSNITKHSAVVQTFRGYRKSDTSGVRLCKSRPLSLSFSQRTLCARVHTWTCGTVCSVTNSRCRVHDQCCFPTGSSPSSLDQRGERLLNATSGDNWCGLRGRIP